MNKVTPASFSLSSSRQLTPSVPPPVPPPCPPPISNNLSNVRDHNHCTDNNQNENKNEKNIAMEGNVRGFREMRNYTDKNQIGNKNEENVVMKENVRGFSEIRKRVVLQKDAKKLSNESQRLAWDHYLKHRPLQDEQKNQPLGFDLDENGEIIRDPLTGKPSSSCCKYNASIRSVKIEEFTDLGPGLALTFRFMQVGFVFFLFSLGLSSIGFFFQLSNPKDITWVRVSWFCDLLFTVAFVIFMCFVRRDMVLNDHEVDEKDITASDYSVKVSGLPKDATAIELAKYFSQFGQLYQQGFGTMTGQIEGDKENNTNLYDNDFDKTGVSIVRNDASFISATYDMIECNDERQQCAPEESKKILLLDTKLQKLNEAYNHLRGKKYECSGTAFVTFMFQDGRNACLNGLKNGKFYYRLNHGHGSIFQLRTKLTKKYRTRITTEIAPDPNDLLWKNLQNSQSHILFRQCVIGFISFLYLFGLGMVMAYFAAHSREYSKYGLISPALLGILGNVLCCVTSIVLLMPIVSTFEGVHSRSTLEIITFLKLGFFQTMGVVLGTLYVFSLDEVAADGRAFSNIQIRAIGSGLPTSNCDIRRFNRYQNVSNHLLNASHLDSDSCFAYTLHLFGSGMGAYLIGTLIADLALINMIDLFCPPWLIETGSAYLKKYQVDVNKIFEGVDYKPFLRYQILLKFLMTALFLSHIDNPRIMYLWVAICFWQSLEIDRYCYVLRYRTPPYFDSSMIRVVIVYVLPVGLIIHTTMHLIFFGLNWKWNENNGQLHVSLREGHVPVVAVIFFVLIGLFLIFWFLPLKFWSFGTNKLGVDNASDGEGYLNPHLSRSASKSLIKMFNQEEGDREKTTTISEEEDRKVAAQLADLSFLDALKINNGSHLRSGDDDQRSKTLVANLLYIEVRKYIPDPTRREFGVLRLN